MAKLTPEERKAQWQKNLVMFKPGVSGNPLGRPKGTSITDQLRKIVEADDGKVADALARVIVKHAAKGDFRFAKEILDRLEGKVTDKLELDADVRTVHQRIVIDDPPADWEGTNDG